MKQVLVLFSFTEKRAGTPRRNLTKDTELVGGGTGNSAQTICLQRLSF